MATTWADAPKDPDAVRDYAMDWTGDIGDETIVTSTWEVVTGTVTVIDDNIVSAGKATVARLAGGVADEPTTVKNHIILSNGEEDEYTSELVIIER